MSSNYSNSGLAAPGCDLSEAYHFQAEVLRTGWILGSLIAYQVRDSIGKGLLDNTWKYHPLLGSLQNSFNTLSSRVTRLAPCSSDPIFSTVQRGLRSLQQSLKKEEIPSDLRAQLGLDSEALGVFSDTPLIVSDIGPDLPNVINPKEFDYLQQVYNSIEKGDSSLTLDASASPQFREHILSDFRIILSTDAGRDLIYTLHKKNITFVIRQGASSTYNSRNKIVEIAEKGTELLFGSPDSDKVLALGARYSILFHELTHTSHDLIIGDIHSWNINTKNLDNGWSSYEEKRTILKTNALRRQLKMGEAGWYGRWGHVGCRCSDDLTERLKLLFTYKARLHDQTNVSESIQQVYKDHGIIDGPPYCPNINKDLIHAVSSKGNDYWINTILTSKRALEILPEKLGYALHEASFPGLKIMVQAILSSKRAGEISPGDLGLALFEASRYGQEGILLAILSYKRVGEIPPIYLGRALSEASRYGDKDSVQAILNSERAQEIPSEYLAKALPVISKNTATVQWIFDKLSWMDTIKYYLGLI